MPMYSIVVPTCGRVSLFLETLKSLEAQSYSSFEVIVTDDSSNESDRKAIREAVAAFKPPKGACAHYLFSKPRLYQAANTNQGLRAATGDLVRILHSDDLLRNDAIEQEVAVFERYPRVDVLFEDCIPFCDSIDWSPEPRATLVAPAYHLRSQLSHTCALPSGLAFRKAVMRETELMNEDLRFLCDWDLFCRLLIDQTRKRQLVCRLTPGLFGWRTHENSVTGTMWKTHFEEHEVFIRELLENPALEELGILINEEERREFHFRAMLYRYDRLQADILSSSPKSRFDSLGWMARQFCRSQFRSHFRKVIRHRRKLAKSSRAAQRKTPAIEPAVPRADHVSIYGCLKSNAEDLAILPYYDNDVMERHPTTLLLDYDNYVHLWPYRDRIAAAHRTRLFYPNVNRMYERVIHEVLKYVATEHEVEILLGGNHHLQWFGLKAVVERLFPHQFSLVGQQGFPNSFYGVTFRREQAPPEYLQGNHSGWTFGFLTLGKNRERTLAYIRSIEQAALPNYEIAVVVPQRLEYLDGIPHLNQIVFNQRDDIGWITRKKNLICEAARYSDILICHDRYELSPTFCKEWATWGYSYGIAGPRVRLADGRRGLDWAVASSQNHTWSSGGLLDYRSYSPYAYIPGGATAVRKSFWQRYPWNENLYWNEHEDVELCRRAQRCGEVISLAPATLIASADRWIDENPIIPFNAEQESLFGTPVGEQRIDFLPMPRRQSA